MLKTKKARDDVTGMNPQLDIAGYSYVFLFYIHPVWTVF